MSTTRSYNARVGVPRLDTPPSSQVIGVYLGAPTHSPSLLNRDLVCSFRRGSARVSWGCRCEASHIGSCWSRLEDGERPVITGCRRCWCRWARCRPLDARTRRWPTVAVPSPLRPRPPELPVGPGRCLAEGLRALRPVRAVGRPADWSALNPDPDLPADDVS